MSRRSETIAPAWFDDLYRSDPDPWDFRTSVYEQEKYGDTLIALSRERYGQALEVGCSVGVFTRMLAPRCDALLAVDASAVALASAREASRDHPNVTFAEAMIPSGFPQGRFDLIVLSEVLYYLDGQDLRRTAGLSLDRLAPGGEMLLCHWLGETDYPLTGDEAAEAFIEAVGTGASVDLQIRRDAYRLDRLLKR